MIIIIGLIALTEIFYDARRKGILTLAICATEEVQKSITKFGIKNDDFNSHFGLQKYGEFCGTIPILEKKNGLESDKIEEGKDILELRGISSSEMQLV